MARKMRQSGVDWIGEIPEGWNIGRLKSYFSYTKGLNITKSDLTESGIPVISYGQIHAKTNSGVCLKSELLRFVSADVARQTPSAKLEVGDIVFADTSEDYEGLGNCVLVDREGVYAGYHDLVAKAKTPDFSKYFAYLFQTDVWRDQFRSRVGGIKVYSVTQRGLNDVYVLVPPHCAQRKITDFLDLKCSEIDRSVSDAKKCIEDYKKLKSSLIEEVATKGVSHSKTRPVDADWIHAVPSEWEFKQIRYLLQLRNERNEKPLSEVNLISLYTDKGVVQHCDLEKTTGNKAATADGYKLVYEDDIVVNIILCWMGAIGRSAYNGVTSPAYDVYRVKNKNEVCPRYYHYLFRTMAFSGACYRRGRGIMMMRWRTYSDQFRSIKVPVPPLNEQTSIADYLDEKCGEIDAIIADKERLIADLETYKKSLIVEVVTGKREVA